MSWFSGIGHSLSKAFKGVDKVANEINPMHHFMGQAADVAGSIWKPLGKAGHWGNDHPAEAAALAATIYFGGGALANAFGGTGAAGAVGAGAAAGEGTAMGAAAGTLGAADSAAASSALGLTAADVGGMGAAGTAAEAAAGAGAAGSSSSFSGSDFYTKLLSKALTGSGGSGSSGGGNSGGGSGISSADGPDYFQSLFNFGPGSVKAASKPSIANYTDMLLQQNGQKP